MRRNPSTVVVLAGPAPAEVLAAVGRSMNVALIRPAEIRPEDSADSGRPGLEAAAGALQRAGRTTAPYALVPADPLAALAASWREMWDVSRQPGPAGFELEAARVLTAWRAGRFELPDYYLVLAGERHRHRWPQATPCVAAEAAAGRPRPFPQGARQRARARRAACRSRRDGLPGPRCSPRRPADRSPRPRR
jgi:hypothetical protein